jgi:N-acyl homoserine lactone hydrolase
MKLYLLELGTLRYFKDRPVCGYLIRCADGTTVLVDTGPDRDGVDDPRLLTRTDPGLLEQLAAVGVRPPDVDLVVCSHLDPDHAGNHDLFPDAEFVVQRSHLELARAGTQERLEAARHRWDLPHLKYRTVEGDTELLPGIDLIESSGHVLGHQSVLLRLPRTGPVLLAVDAITQEAALDPEQRPMTRFDLDHDAARASTRKLVDRAARAGAWIIRGHDHVQWPTLRHWPEHYA